MQHRRQGLGVRTVLLATVLLLVAAGAALAAGSAPVRGGTLNVGMEADWPTLDPLGMGALSDRQAAQSIYDTLLEMDEHGHIVPNLAEITHVSPDAKSYRIKVRAGVRFHDGTPLDAKAVVFNFKRLLDPANHCRCTADLSSIADVVATGPLEVEFRMKEPFAPLPAVLADVSGMMISPTAVQKEGKDYGAHPVGTGPFVFKEWKRGNYMLAVRNPNYWKPGQPYLDSVYYRPMPDEQTRMAALTAGNIDIYQVPAARDLNEALHSGDQGPSGLQVVDAGSLGTV
ncbi:MAG TPA: ABC transporter substrate-binding protein, partial [bacterium]|nr:ABC transporter substrate-binding protein [bacterium]